MRRVRCAIALGVVAAGSPAMAQTYGWDGGGGDASYFTDANWRNDDEPPPTGTHGVSIKASNLTGPQQVADWDGSSSGSCGTLEVVANGTYYMTFRKSGSASFSVSSTTTLTGADASHESTLDADAALTLTDLKDESYVTLDVASSVTVDVNGTLALDATNGYTECEKIGSGTITPDALVVDVGDGTGESSMFVISAGAINVTGSDPSTAVYGSHSTDIEGTILLDGGTLDPGDLKLFGGTSSSREAVFAYASGTVANADSITLYGFSRMDIDDDFDSDGDFTVTVAGGDTFASEARIDKAFTVLVTVPKVVVGHSTYACKLIGSGSGTLTTDAQ